MHEDKELRRIVWRNGGKELEAERGYINRRRVIRYTSFDSIAVANWNESEMGKACNMEGEKYKSTRFLVGKH